MRKLYYEDSHIRSFQATVTGCVPAPQGYAITLDATAFYPEGGGQACDLGTLGNTRVLDVREKDGQVVHICTEPLAVGTAVTGSIDWERRFDLMQQHTGEHIISGLLHSAFGYHNTGFHVGKDVMEVDFDGPVTPEDLSRIEYLANQAVWADLELKCWTPDPDELETVTYRTKRALAWPVRIVQVPGYDSCACCGVHVRRTGEVGLIKILTCVKFHGGIRLEMVCGQRAYRYMQRIFEENRAVSQAFSVPVDATGSGAQKMVQSLAAAKATLSRLQGLVFASIAEKYAGQSRVVHYEEGLEPGQVRNLADRIAAVTGEFCMVYSGSDGACSYCLAARQGDLRELNRQLCAALQGRGGGKPNFQQGSLRCSVADVADFFRNLSQ